MRKVLAAIGLLLIGYAGYGALTDPGARLVGQVWFTALLVAGHDLVLLPVAVGVGWLVSRWLPGWARGAVRFGLFGTAVVTAVAVPFLIGNGHPADNPSALPLDYGRGLAMAIGAVWLVAAASLLPRPRSLFGARKVPESGRIAGTNGDLQRRSDRDG